MKPVDLIAFWQAGAPMVGAWLLTFLLQSTVLLGAVWLAERFGLLRHPRTREVAWKAALVGAVLTSVLQAFAGGAPLGGAIPLAASVGKTAEHAAGPTRARPAPAWVDVAPGRETLTPAAPRPPAAVHAQPAVWRPDPGPVAARILGGIATLWLAGAFVLLARWSVARARLFRRIGDREPVMAGPLRDTLDRLAADAGIGDVQLSASTSLMSPVAVGAREICVPPAAIERLDANEQRSLLAHELAHLVRRDPAWLSAAYLLEHLLFVQPLVRIARRRIQSLAELLCDDWAVRRTGSSLALARCLATIAEWGRGRRPLPLPGMAESRAQLVDRIERLVEGPRMSAPISSHRRTAGIAGMLGLAALAIPGFVAVRHQPASATGVAVSSADVVDADMVQDRDAPPPAAPAAPARPPAAPRAEIPLSRRWERDVASAPMPMTMLSPMRHGAPRLSDEDRQPADPRTVAALGAALRDSDPGVREAAARSLGGLDDTTAVPALMAASKDPNVDVRRAVLGALESLDDPRAFPVFVDATKDADPEVRAIAANALGQLDDPRATPALTALLADKSADVRRDAALALGQLGLTAAPPALLGLLDDPDAEVRCAAVQALGEIRDPKAVPGLKARLGDNDAEVREAAVGALGEIRDASALEALIGALKDPQPGVRKAAAEALGQQD